MRHNAQLPDSTSDHPECDDTHDEWVDDDTDCERCHGDGMDPWSDYLFPCPLCQGEQRS